MTDISDERMQVALKVLTSWMDGKPPSLEDIRQLQSYKPELHYLAPDELGLCRHEGSPTHLSVG